MNAPVFFESAGDERGTPQDFFDKLNAEFHFDLDAAADERNHKCELYFGKGGIAFDALEEDWGGEGTTVFLNPPYSVAGAFVQKAREEADKGAVVVLLLPVRSDNKWFHKYVWDTGMSRLQGTVEILPGGMPKYSPLVTNQDGDFRTGVRFRFVPGRLNFELKVPLDMRAWIRAECAGIEALSDIDRAKTVAAMVEATGLPKMAIQRILLDYPDEDLMEAAPFPSCVVIFTKAS